MRVKMIHGYRQLYHDDKFIESIPLKVDTDSYLQQEHEKAVKAGNWERADAFRELLKHRNPNLPATNENCHLASGIFASIHSPCFRFKRNTD